MSKTLDLTQWEHFKARMEEAGILGGEQAKNLVKEATTAAVVALDREVRKTLPPPQIKKKAADFWTDKQFRWWWATMRAKALGKSRALPGWDAHYEIEDGRKVLVIDGAYKRTGTLIKTLTYKVETGIKDNVAFARATYGTNRPYAKWVIDEDDQAEYHKGNWQTLQGFLRVAREPIMKEFGRVLTQEIRKRLL